MKTLALLRYFLLPIRLYGGGGGSSQDFGASELFAQSARNRWDQIKKSVWPLEQKALSFTRGALGPEAQRYATESINTAFDNQEGALRRDLARQGTAPTEAQNTAMQRQLSQERTGALASAQNTARRMVKETQDNILSGGVAANKFLSKQGGGGVQ